MVRVVRVARLSGRKVFRAIRFRITKGFGLIRVLVGLLGFRMGTLTIIVGLLGFWDSSLGL